MLVHNISAAPDLFIISTCCRPLVAGKSFSHPIYFIGLIPTCIQVLSEPSCAPNIFLVPPTWNNTLRPTYNGDVPRHQDEELYHRHHRNGPVVTPLPLLFSNILSSTRHVLTLDAFAGWGLT